MVTKKVEWLCDICGTMFGSEREAKDCEMNGRPAEILETGFIFQTLDFGDNEDTIYGVKVDDIIGHHHRLELWTYTYGKNKKWQGQQEEEALVKTRRVAVGKNGIKLLNNGINSGVKAELMDVMMNFIENKGFKTS